MYINDINILYYTIIAIIGGIVGQIVDYCNYVFLYVICLSGREQADCL